MEVTTFGLDLAKRVLQLHWVEMETGEICRRQLKRGQVLEFFANRERSVIAMEACGSAHYWARKLAGLGHEVRLIAAQFVRPFVKTNKTDAADAQAIWEAAQPAMVIETIRSQLKRIEALDQDIAQIERHLAAWKKDDKAAKRLMDIPGVGLLTATADVGPLANKMARTIWALLAHDRTYEKGYVAAAA